MLLGPEDPPPAVVLNERGASPYVLIGDHAGRAIPARLGDLGVPAAAMDMHIAWDIGVAGMGDRLSALIDAPFIRQTYSRLVLDCNRWPDADDQAPAVSDSVAIPGNANLSAADLSQRRDAILGPYQSAIARLLDARRGAPCVLVSLHSFTPIMQAFVRPWHYGVLHRGDSPASSAMLQRLKERFGEAAGDNEPYAMDARDYTIPHHCDRRGLDYLELEVRQDLIADAAGQEAAAVLLAELLTGARPPVGSGG